MSIEGIPLMVPGLSASADMSTTGQYLFAKMSGDFTVATCASTIDCPVGVVTNNPKQYDAASVQCGGVAKVKSSDTFAAGDRVYTHSDGTAKKAVEGTNTTNYVVGMALQAAASGDIFSVLLYGIPHRAS